MALITDSSGTPIQASEINQYASLSLDGKQLTENLEILDGVLSWKPGPAFFSGDELSGQHTATLLYRDNAGAATQKAWSFLLLEENKRTGEAASAKWGQSGRAYAGFTHYGLNGDQTAEAVTGGNYHGYFGKWRYGAELCLTTTEDDKSQPRNLYSINIGYGKYFDLQAGDAAPAFNSLVVGGPRVRGVMLSTHSFSGKGVNVFNLDVAYGQVRRAVDPFRKSGADTSWNFGTYSRNILAVKTAFGYGEAFQFGLLMLKGRDDTLSIRQASDSAASASDTIYWRGETPKDNLVIGADLIARLFKDRAELFGTYALSLFTRDISNGALTKDDLKKAVGEEVDLDPSTIANFIIFNTSFTPISFKGTGILNSSAIEGGLRLKLPFGKVDENAEVKYEKIGANYYSMGAPLLGVPRAGFSVTSRTGFLENRLGLNAGFSAFENSDGSGGPVTQQNAYSLQLDFYKDPAWPGFSMGYSKNGVKNTDSTYGFDNGVGIFNVSSNYRFQTRNRFQNQVQLFVASTGIDNGWKSVHFDSTSAASVRDTSLSLSTMLYSLAYTAVFPNRPLTLSGAYTGNLGSVSFVQLQNWSANASYGFIPKKLRLNTGLSLSRTKLPTQTETESQWKIRYGGVYNPHPAHALRYEGSFSAGIHKPDAYNRLFYEFRF